MPRNCADALLMLAALREAVLRTYGVTDFIFLSDDADFGGVAAVLRAEGFRCWRICRTATPNTTAGFDQVIALIEPPSVPCGSVQRPMFPMPADLLPPGRHTLSIQQLAARVRALPEAQRNLRAYGRKLSQAIRRCALANNWPVVVEGQGDLCRIRRIPRTALTPAVSE
jgi:hypothetical protein